MGWKSVAVMYAKAHPAINSETKTVVVTKKKNDAESRLLSR